MAGNSLQDSHIGMLQLYTSLTVIDAKMNVIQLTRDHLEADDDLVSFLPVRLP